MGEGTSEKLRKQYQNIADIIEVEGLGYAFTGGYIKPNTDDGELNAAITKVLEGLAEFERIMMPYKY